MKKPRIAHATAAILGTCLATGLVACSSTPDASSSRTTTSAATASSNNGPVTITFMEAMSSGKQKEALEKITKDFEKANPNIKVELQEQPDYNTLHTKISAQTAAGDAPTLAQMYPDWAAEFLNADLLVDLTAHAKASSDYQGFREGVKKDLTVGTDKVWLYPFNKSVIVVYRNENKVPQAPQTWEEFAQVAKAGSTGDIVALSIDPGSTAGPAGANQLFDVLAESFGDPVFKADGTPQFDAPGVVKALQYLVDLKQHNALALGQKYPGQTALGNEKGLFDVASVAGLPFTQKAVGDKFKLGVSALPTGEKGAKNSLAGTNVGLFNTAKKAQQEAALKYMDFLAAPQQQSYWASETGYLPISEAAEKLEPFASYEQKNAWVAAAAKQLDTASTLPPKSTVTAASGPLATAIKDAVDNGVDAKAALEKAQKDALKLSQNK